MANTILLKGRGIRKEAVAGGTITPGNLLTINASGQLIRHATAGGKAASLWAVESEGLKNESTTPGGIDDNYVAGDFVQAEYVGVGCEVYALVAAGAASIAAGALLESDGTGGLRVLTAGSVTGSSPVTGVVLPGNAIAQALEAVDNSGGANPARIKVVIL